VLDLLAYWSYPITMSTNRIFLFAATAGLLLTNFVVSQISLGPGKPIVAIAKGDMVILGEVWVPENANDKPRETFTYIHCERQVGMCAIATGNGNGVHADILSVASWTSKRVILRGDKQLGSPCWNAPDYVVDVTNGRVYQILLPGPQSNMVECRIAPWQPPRKTVFELAHSMAIDHR